MIGEGEKYPKIIGKSKDKTLFSYPEGVWQGSSPLQVPKSRTLLLSKLIMALAISLYLSTAFFTANMSNWRDAKTVISSAYEDTFALIWLAKGAPRRAGLAYPSLSLRSRASKART